MKPFDLDAALRHPNWVRHEDGTRAATVEYRPEVAPRYRVRIEWSDRGTGTYPVDSGLIGMDPPETCQWAEEDGSYYTGCVRKFDFAYGTPSGQGFKFCPFCGKEIGT